MKKYITRNCCVITQSSTLRPLYTIKDFPILMSLVDDMNYENDITLDMEWVVSDHGNVCLKTLIDPSLLYSYSHNPGTIGQVWKSHHERFFNFVNKNNYQNVLEIGGSSGNLLNIFLSQDKNFNWTILEPALSRNFTDSRVYPVKDFFENFKTEKQYDTVIHSHVFEHIYEPIEFLKKINSLLTSNGYQYLSIPNLTKWMENNFCSSLSFEHTFFVDENIVEYLLNKTGFKIVDKHVDDHSIFIKAMKVSCSINTTTNFSYVEDIFKNYIKRLEQEVLTIKKSVGLEKYYLFGGTVNSQFLLKMGLDESNLINLLDNDPLKHDKRLYGTKVLVKSPSILKDVSSPVVIVRSGPYNEEIKNGILQINPTVRFL